MKKLFILSIISIITSGASAATPWWQQAKVCKLNPTSCYTGMGAGYDSDMWDSGNNCWGLKLICPEALTATANEPVAMIRKDISNRTGIKPDFDTNVLNGDCFGARKVSSNGSQASVGGTFVNVWCSGILNTPDETVANGEITYGTQPTCKELKENGFVGVPNGRCYGKYYSPSEYYIECSGNAALPDRIIVLNGADYENASAATPNDMQSANALFDAMQRTAEANKKIYYSQN